MLHGFDCARCSECVRVCVRKAINRTESGMQIDLDQCFRCGHCVAVCPTDQIEHPLSPRQEMIGELPVPADMKRYLRAARSVRRYKDELVPREKMAELIDIGTYAQTGNNSQGVRYLVVSGRDKVNELNRMALEAAARWKDEYPSLGWIASLDERQRETGDDILFRTAPQLIFALGDREKGSRANAQFALTYIALYAPSLGVGTCWAGIFEGVALNEEASAPIRAYLDIPEDLRIFGVLMAGVPDVRFRRLAARDPLLVDWRE